jgi:hypothetical protein
MPRIPTALLTSLCECKGVEGFMRRADACGSPGWVHTGLTGAKENASKPSGAWSPEQTVDYMTERVFEEGDFYVICPDNETTSVSIASSPYGVDLIASSEHGQSENRLEYRRYH